MRLNSLASFNGQIGILGGGQLARMLVHASQSMGVVCTVLDPDAASPAGAVAERHLRGDYVDTWALDELAARCAAITIEFENVPAEALRRLAMRVPVAPSTAAVEICQDRLAEKRRFTRAGVPCAPHAAIDGDAFGTADDGRQAALLPGILKTARLGYDGKGQIRIGSLAALRPAWERLGGVCCVLEKLLPLQHEISVIVARGADGALVHLPPQQNLHRDGILAVTQVPAPDVAEPVLQQAVVEAGRLAASMDYVGVLCVEFFVLADGALVANEMAPRPHNSGHYSIDACDVSQFQLQLRATLGLPLVMPRLHSPAVMLNLLGDLWLPDAPDWAPVLALPGVHLHLYGKADARPGRKMGHLTVTAADAAGARGVAHEAAALLGLPPF